MDSKPTSGILNTFPWCDVLYKDQFINKWTRVGRLCNPQCYNLEFLHTPKRPVTWSVACTTASFPCFFLVGGFTVLSAALAMWRCLWSPKCLAGCLFSLELLIKAILGFYQISHANSHMSYHLNASPQKWCLGMENTDKQASLPALGCWLPRVVAAACRAAIAKNWEIILQLKPYGPNAVCC